MKKVVFLFVFSLFVSFALLGQGFQYRSKYPDIPIVDVHSHACWVSHAKYLIEVSDTIKQRHGSNLAFWIGLDPVADPAKMKTVANNRMLFAVRPRSDNAVQARPHNAYEERVKNNFYADEVVQKVHHDGYVGLKIWFGPHDRRGNRGQVGLTMIDDPIFAPFFSKLEEENILLTSLHVADPNGPFVNRKTDTYLRSMVNDPVWFWKQIRAFENVVAKYPNLTIVAAHAAFLFSQDAQVDYLRYMLSTYPNLYVDISATDFHLHYSNRDNLRDFFIEYQDRILFGLDDGYIGESRLDFVVNWYAHFFSFLETDQIVNLGYLHNLPTKGLELPREALEKIYYRNALKLYPGLREAMGYPLVN